MGLIRHTVVNIKQLAETDTTQKILDMIESKLNILESLANIEENHLVSMTTFLEAEGQSIEEKVWVASTIYNRAKQPDMFPNLFPMGVFKDYSGWQRTINWNNPLVQKAYLDSIRASVVAKDITEQKDNPLQATFYCTKHLLMKRGLLDLSGNLKVDLIGKKIFGIKHKLEVLPTPIEFAHVYFKLVED
jgi:hypothetical protein